MALHFAPVPALGTDRFTCSRIHGRFLLRIREVDLWQGGLDVGQRKGLRIAHHWIPLQIAMFTGVLDLPGLLLRMLLSTSLFGHDLLLLALLLSHHTERWGRMVPLLDRCICSSPMKIWGD